MPLMWAVGKLIMNATGKDVREMARMDSRVNRKFAVIYRATQAIGRSSAKSANSFSQKRPHWHNICEDIRKKSRTFVISRGVESRSPSQAHSQFISVLIMGTNRSNVHTAIEHSPSLLIFPNTFELTLEQGRTHVHSQGAPRTSLGLTNLRGT